MLLSGQTSSEWVPLLTISSDDFKNASTPLSTEFEGTTTSMTPTETAVLEGNTTVTSEEATTVDTPTFVPGDSQTDINLETVTTEKASTGSNETTTVSPADLFGNSTVRPAFPSLEGVDYRMSKYQVTHDR